MITREHLGDGAYVTLEGEHTIIITANHDDPAQASDVVYLDRDAFIRMAAIAAQHYNTPKE